MEESKLIKTNTAHAFSLRLKTNKEQQMLEEDVNRPALPVSINPGLSQDSSI